MHSSSMCTSQLVFNGRRWWWLWGIWGTDSGYGCRQQSNCWSIFRMKKSQWWRYNKAWCVVSAHSTTTINVSVTHCCWPFLAIFRFLARPTISRLKSRRSFSICKHSRWSCRRDWIFSCILSSALVHFVVVLSRTSSIRVTTGCLP